jgi:hypothetical protein
MTTFSTDGPALEKGTKGIQVAFTDENDNAVTPKSATWTLTNRPARGIATTIVNGREDVAIGTLAGTVTIVLSGNDLSFLSAEDEEILVERVFTVEYVYDSDLGLNLPGKAQYIFPLERLYISED